MGGHDEEALKEFAKSIKPSCPPYNIDLCYDESQRTEIARLLPMHVAELNTFIKKKEKHFEDSETLFKTKVDKLQAAYDKLKKDTEVSVNQAKESGLGLKKAVKAMASFGKGEL